MPKNTKDLSEKKVTGKSKKEVDNSSKKTAVTKNAAKKTATAKKTTASKSAAKKTSATKKTASKTSTSTKKSTNTTKKKTSVDSKKVAKTTKKASTSSKKTTKKKIATTKKVEVIEYYDLPYRYNQTVVKILAQTPTTLFVYWDISDEDRKKYIDKFGENFFENTVPVLIVHNITMNYSFEIEINDFANSWYFNINDARCDYEIELGRRAKQKAEISIPNNYMHVTSSNVIEAPNNQILFDKNQKILFFKNVKTNATISKDMSKFEYMNYAGRIYNIYDVYKNIYKNEELDSLEKMSSSTV